MAGNINISDELKELGASSLVNASRNNIYFLPGDFFINLSDNITRQIWLNSVPKINPYFIPAGYFENLSELIFDKIAINSNKLISSQDLYNVPDGYFNNLAENILENIKTKNNSVQQELEELSPLLSKIPKINVYTIPAEYFESFIAVPQQEVQPAKVISIKRKPHRWIAYAAAACIAAFMFGGGYYYMQGNISNNNSVSTAQSQISDLKVQQGLAQLSDAEIDNYLNNDNSEVYTPQNNSEDINIKTLLENMSDEEINNYLRENSDPGENMKGI
jgi:hypothetical protein